MSKMYIVTAVDFDNTRYCKPKTIEIAFDSVSALNALNDDMKKFTESLKEDEIRFAIEGLSITYNNGVSGCVWNIEEKEVQIPLTPLQFTELNGIANMIANAETTYEGESEDLSAEEDDYLRRTLERNYSMHIDKKGEE